MANAFAFTRRAGQRFLRAGMITVGDPKVREQQRAEKEGDRHMMTHTSMLVPHQKYILYVSYVLCVCT